MNKKQEITIEIIKNSTIDDYSKNAKYTFSEEQMNKAIDDLVKLLAIPDVSPCNYEYEYLFRSEENEPCPINGWYPITTERIKHPEKIPEYLANGILRHYKG